MRDVRPTAGISDHRRVDVSVNYDPSQGIDNIIPSLKGLLETINLGYVRQLDPLNVMNVIGLDPKSSDAEKIEAILGHVEQRLKYIAEY